MRVIVFLLIMAPTLGFAQQQSQYAADSTSIMRDCSCVRLKEATYKDEDSIRYKVYLDQKTGEAFIIQRVHGRGKRSLLFRYEMVAQK